MNLNDILGALDPVAGPEPVEVGEHDPEPDEVEPGDQAVADRHQIQRPFEFLDIFRIHFLV